jgi:hypothetical protein
VGKGHIKTPKILQCLTCKVEFLGKHYKSKYCSRHCCKTYSGTRESVVLSNRRGKYFTLYGITIDEYDTMSLQQDGKCKICGETPHKLFVDHCHSTNKVRGLLCMKCNAALGLFKDKVSNLQNAILYLDQGEELKKVRG